MARFVLDTQHYIEVLKGRPAGHDVIAFLHAYAGAVDFHAVVGAELLFGAHARGEPRAIRQRLIDPFRAHRIIAPDANDLLAAGDAIRRMTARWGAHPELEQRSLWNDVLIAISCRRRGRILLTRDPDHARIATVVGHAYAAMLPPLP